MDTFLWSSLLILKSNFPQQSQEIWLGVTMETELRGVGGRLEESWKRDKVKRRRKKINTHTQNPVIESQPAFWHWHIRKDLERELAGKTHCRLRVFGVLSTQHLSGVVSNPVYPVTQAGKTSECSPSSVLVCLLPVTSKSWPAHSLPASSKRLTTKCDKVKLCHTGSIAAL